MIKENSGQETRIIWLSKLVWGNSWHSWEATMNTSTTSLEWQKMTKRTRIKNWFEIFHDKGGQKLSEQLKISWHGWVVKRNTSTPSLAWLKMTKHIRVTKLVWDYSCHGWVAVHLGHDWLGLTLRQWLLILILITQLWNNTPVHFASIFNCCVTQCIIS